MAANGGVLGPNGCGCLGLLFLGFLSWVAVNYVMPDDWKIKYAILDDVSVANVTLNERPTNCDWWHAPLGEKSCHYEKVEVITMWRKGQSGDAQVSFDYGRTWDSPMEFMAPSPPGRYLYVRWDKKDDP